MKLEKKYNKNNKEYYCDLTRKLDDVCGYTVSNPRYKHYIYDARDLWDKTLAIRVPGRTTGNIEVDNNNIITKISFSTELVGDIKQYPSNTDIKMEKYIGIALEFQGRHDK